MKRAIIASLLACAVPALAVDRPDPTLTPGATRTATVDLICHTKTAAVRDVSEKTKRQVYERYGLTAPRTGYCSGSEGCEVDHLISLGLGGSNAVENLWPQPYQGNYNARMKDKLENRLRKMVCSGELNLETAQSIISKDWIGAYKKLLEDE